MDTVVDIILLVSGLVMLWKSADLLVAGAVKLAKQFGISSLVVGLTVVAMGTSAPEVAASIAAALRHSGDVALGNVYGSNIANLALVGGLCAIIKPMKLPSKMIRREIPIMILAALSLFPLVFDKFLSRAEGIFLLILSSVLTFLIIYSAKKECQNNSKPEKNTKNNHLTKNIIFIVAGLLGLAAGAEATVRGAIGFGKLIGLSEAVIGLTIVAVGTSLPELTTSIVALTKGHHDLSIGNLVGSNIFNALFVTGIACTVRPFGITARLAGTDYWAMISVSIGFAFLVIIGRHRITRTSGVILLCSYIANIWLAVCS